MNFFGEALRTGMFFFTVFADCAAKVEYKNFYLFLLLIFPVTVPQKVKVAS
jgi:hypothetical protein